MGAAGLLGNWEAEGQALERHPWLLCLLPLRAQPLGLPPGAGLGRKAGPGGAGRLLCTRPQVPSLIFIFLVVLAEGTVSLFHG